MFFKKDSLYFAGRRPRIMAHRGASGTCPENTMLSFKQALSDGADVLEMDVQVSEDGEAVVIHDPSVDRTCNAHGLVRQFKYSALCKFDAAYRYTADGGITFPFRAKGVCLPRFEDVLRDFPRTPINVEIKDSSPVLISRMSQLLRKYGRFDEGSVLVAADSHQIMQAFRKAAPEAITGSSSREVYRFVIGSCLHLPDCFIRPAGYAFQIPATKKGLSIAGATVIKRAQDMGAEIHVWTVNDPLQMKSLIKLGVDGIFTDHPALMKNLLSQRSV